MISPPDAANPEVEQALMPVLFFGDFNYTIPGPARPYISSILPFWHSERGLFGDLRQKHQENIKMD